MSRAELLPKSELNLIWVYSDDLSTTMDAATWIETTRELHGLGWQVTLITAGPAELKAIRGVPVLVIEKPNVYFVRQFTFHFQVLNEIRKRYRSTDIVLFHQMSAPWIFLLRAGRGLFGADFPLLIMDTRTAPMVPKEIAPRRERWRTVFVDTMNDLANRWADGQTAITLRMAKLMGIPDTQLLGVWPSGVSRGTFSSASTERRWPENDELVRLVYVGRLDYERNLISMCEAVELANAQGMRFQFTLVGDGTERTDLELFAERTNGRVVVLPPVPHETVPSLLAGAHVGVLPFPDRESFRVSSPIKLFEYLASGLPILATKIECHTDVVGDDQYVFWADNPSVEALAEALAETWEERHALASLGRLAQEASAAWTWAAAAGKLDRALRLGVGQVDFQELQTST